MKVLDPQTIIHVRGWGLSWPERKVTNRDLVKRFPDIQNQSETFLDLMEKKISLNYDSSERFMSHLPGDSFSSSEETSESLALKACRQALSVSPSDLEMFILASTTSRRYSGSQATSVLGQLQLSAPAYEFKAGCSGSLAGLNMGFGFLSMGYKNVLVSSAETLSKVAHPEIKESWFGLADGAAALWIEKGDGLQKNSFLVEKTAYSTDGSKVELYTTKGDLPPRQEAIDANEYFLQGDSAKMREEAKKRYLETVHTLLPNQKDRKKISWVIPHQVSRSLIDEIVSETQLSGKVHWNAKEYGNLGGASVLFSFCDAIEKQIFKKDDRILFLSVGGGLSYAGQIWKVLN